MLAPNLPEIFNGPTFFQGGSPVIFEINGVFDVTIESHLIDGSNIREPILKFSVANPRAGRICYAERFMDVENMRCFRQHTANPGGTGTMSSGNENWLLCPHAQRVRLVRIRNRTNLRQASRKYRTSLATTFEERLQDRASQICAFVATKSRLEQRA